MGEKTHMVSHPCHQCWEGTASFALDPRAAAKKGETRGEAGLEVKLYFRLLL